ncbi:toll-like receptor 13 isoform X1 [Ostrea edulis]|uniref:toll-like receptor 13 isoform X1 n=1 Tax=Ostrea edulis TaxID=37623 RepID=UPI0024AF0983|nr:toll-like receptor 13 isoform X1 [Ostrea edulis]XP_048749204.2 toll-like receptor 13 isoform X1 [Ostrea edulis]XP_048749211.2 toll-like receptor 13 isoform X1 [Ostrea edulis]XP_056008717.1 toll-like receptor 13 isoform X1 [Ostrea edulis]
MRGMNSRDIGYRAHGVYVLVLLGLFTAITNGCPSVCQCAEDIADCSNKNLSYIPYLPNPFRKIYLSGNFYQNITSRTFHNISANVYFLDVSNCKIRQISSQAFAGLQQLRLLNISYNKFGQDQISVSSIFSLNISSLDLSGTNTNLDFFASIECFSLEKLFLKNNQINGVVNGSSFVNMPNIRELALDDNGIYNISVEGLKKLSNLSLKLNEFIFFPKFCDSSNGSLTPSLVYLDLQQNHISNLIYLYKAHRCVRSLTHLVLSYNPIRILRNETFAGLPCLTHLYLDNLFSVEMIIEDMSLASDTLQELYIGNIGAKTPPRFRANYVFKNSSELVKLDMSHMYLMESNVTSLLQPLIKLKELILYGCRLLEIPPAISRLFNLTSVNLGNNYIGSFSSHLFENLKHLKKLALFANRISVIDTNSISPAVLSRLHELDVRWNPYACTCDLYWFINHIMKEKKTILISSDPSDYRCSSPIHMYNRTLSSYDPSYYQCHSLTTQEVVVIATSSTFVLLIMLVVFYKKYKWHIKYYLYLLRSRKGYERIGGTDDETFLFDAFVAYNEDDRSWVISNLMSELEGKEQYRLCLHERDFLPGKTIFSQISHTIQRSRKVILVISNSFAKSQWCQYETLVAQNRLIDDGANVLIVVLLGEIQSKFRTESLYMLLKTMTYIRWPPANSPGRELFWNKVKLAMKP